MDTRIGYPFIALQQCYYKNGISPPEHLPSFITEASLRLQPAVSQASLQILAHPTFDSP
jgi:hypothetical protein